MEELKSLGGKLFSKKPFKRLQNLQLLKQKSSEEFQIEFFTGEYVSKNKIITCIFRKIRSSSTSALLQTAISELKAIQSVHNSLLFVKYFGYYFDEQKSEYLQISKRYKKTLFDTTFSKDLAIEISHDILKGIQFLHENQFYHGAISPFSIFLDDFNNVKIGNLWHAGEIKEFKRNFEQWGRTSSFLHKDFVSPEVMLLQSFKAAGLRMKIFRPRKSDMFSIGLTIMYIAGVSVKGLNMIKMDITIFENKPVNRSDTNLEPLIGCKISQLQVKVFKAISKVYSELLRLICQKSLVVFYMERITAAEIMRKIKSTNLKVPVSRKVINDEKLVDSQNRKYLKLLNEMVFHFSHFMHSIRKLPNPLPDEPKLALKALVAALKTKYEGAFEFAFNSFFNSKCSETLDSQNINNGIFVFFRSFFREISIEAKLLEILNLSTEIQENTNFIKCFDFIINKVDEVTCNYLIASLLVLQINDKDWNFFFNNDIPTCPSAIPIESYQDLTADVVKVLKSQIVSDILLQTFGKVLDDEFISTKILQKLYLIKTLPSHYGLTTYDLRMYIDNFGINSGNLRSKGAICVVILQEIRHVITGIDCESRRDVKNRLTVEGEIISWDVVGNKLPENLIKENQGEARFELEKKIFGRKVKWINDSSTEVLLDIDKYLKGSDFSEDFTTKNKDKRKSISLTKGVNFDRVGCPMRLMCINQFFNPK